MQLRPFAIERWYARYEFQHPLHAVQQRLESRTVAEVLAFEPDAAEPLLGQWCGCDRLDHVRVGFGRANLPEALERLDAMLQRAGRSFTGLDTGHNRPRP